MTIIHPSAQVHPEAELGKDVEVGPFAVVHKGAVIRDGTKIDAHAVIFGNVRIGKNNYIGVGSVIGGDPQDVSYKGQPTFLEIGDNNTIREFVTIHRASREGCTTKVGNNCYIMAYAHIAHDCKIGNGVIITNYAGISGFVEIGDRAVISGHVGIHQFVRIGSLAIISGGSFLGQDIPPFVIASGRPAKVVGLNIVGLKRAGIPEEERLNIKRAFDLFYRKEIPRKEALAELEKYDSPYVKAFVEFIKKSKRGVARFARQG